MNTVRKPQADAAETLPLRITLEGPPELVKQLLAGMQSAMAAQAMPQGEPTQLFLNSISAAAYTGLSTERLAGLVKAGRLTNHGKGRILLFSRAELTALAE